MKKLKAERLEGSMVIFSDEEKKLFAIERDELPANVKIGSTIIIDNEGNVEVSPDKSKSKR